MSIKKATWVLTDTRHIFFHVFTCSSCGRTVTATQHFNNGNFDFKESIKDLMNDYPYCHCGAKMSKDTSIPLKMEQMKITRELRNRSPWPSNIKEKRFWKVDEEPIIDPVAQSVVST